MKPRRPEDGSLEKITSSGLNSEFNTIIIERTDEIEEPDGDAYIFATLDRTREGVEWPGDQILEKLIPELPKVKTLEVKKPDATIKIYSPHRHRIERKYYQRPVHRNFTKRRTKPPSKRFCSERSENPSSSNDIDPWVYKPWENQIISGVNSTASVSATSLISTAPFNNLNVPSSASSLPFPPRTSNNVFNVPNSTYEKNIRPTANSNIQFIFRPSPTNRMHVGPHPPFLLQNRFSQYPNSSFRAPVPNRGLNGPNLKPCLLGSPPAARYPIKHGLLGDGPFPNMHFNRNRFPNGISAQSHPEGNTANLHPRNEEDVGDKNSFTKNNSFVSSYDTAYGKIPRSNFDHYEDSNEISGQKSHDSYSYRSSGGSDHHYEDQYGDSYNNLSQNHPKDNNKNISSKNSRDSHKTDYRKFKKHSIGVSRSESGYKEFEDSNVCESNYEGRQISTISQTSTFMSNQNRNPKSDSVFHLSESAVVYDPEDFPNDTYPTAASNITSRSNLNDRYPTAVSNSTSRPNLNDRYPTAASNSSRPNLDHRYPTAASNSTSGSNLNSVSRSNFRRNFHTKNTPGRKKQWTTNKFTNNNNYWQNRVKYNRGQQRFKKWRTPPK